MQEAGKKGAEGLASIRREALALIGVFTAGVGIKNFIENTIGGTAKLGRSASDLNMSARALAEWQLAAKRAGGTAEGITAALAAAQATVGGAKIGQIDGNGQAFLQYAGQTGVDTKAIYSDADTLLKAQAEVIKRVRDRRGEDVARVVASQMGISGDQYNFLKQGGAAVEQARKDQERLAATQAALVEKADALRKKWIDFQNTLEDTAITVLTDLMPAFDRGLHQLGEWAKWIDDHRDDISNWVKTAVDEIVKFIDKANDAANAVGGWQNVLIALAALKIVSMVSPILALAGALGGVGVSLAGIATSGVGALGVLAGLGVVAEKERQRALDATIPAGPNHDQYVAEADAGGIVTPGQTGDWAGWIAKHFKAAFSNSEAGRQKQAVDFFMKNGWSAQQSAGIVGSLTQESNVDPTAQNPNSGAYGIGQWLSKDRLAAFKAWSGKDIHNSSFEEQLGFMQYELTKGSYKKAGDAIKNSKTSDEAAKLHSDLYEIPGAAEANVKNRQIYAALVYKRLLDTDPNVGKIPSPDDMTIQAMPRGKIPSPDDMTIQAMPGGAATSAPVAGATNTTTVTTTTNINGPINVNTRATDAKGIAQALPAAIKRADMTTHANSGVQ